MERASFTGIFRNVLALTRRLADVLRLAGFLAAVFFTAFFATVFFAVVRVRADALRVAVLRFAAVDVRRAVVVLRFAGLLVVFALAAIGIT